MIILKTTHLVMFDIDDTLRMWNTGAPHSAMIDQLKRHHHAGHSVGVWSKGGTMWAAKVVDELGLQDLVYVVMEKPHWIYDDKPVHTALGNTQYIQYVAEKKPHEAR